MNFPAFGRNSRAGTCGAKQQATLRGNLFHQGAYLRYMGSRYIIKCNASDDKPDWDAEMSIFKKRTLKPSQLEALRKLEEDSVSSGKVRTVQSCIDQDSIYHAFHACVLQVLLVRDSIAIVEGLNSDCEVGTALVFSSGAKGCVQ